MTGGRQRVGVIGVEHDDDRAVTRVGVVGAEARERVGQRGEDAFRHRVVAGLGHDEHRVGRLDVDHRHRRVTGPETERGVQRRQGRGGLVLCHAVGERARVPVQREVGHARETAADVDQAEPKGPADRDVRPMPVAEYAEAGSDTGARRGGPVDDEKGRRAVGRALDLGHVEHRIADGTDRGDDHRHVLGPAAGHDRVDRHALERRLAHRRPDAAERDRGVEVRRAEKSLDPLGGRHDHGQAVGAASVVQPLERGIFVVDRDARRCQLVHPRSPVTMSSAIASAINAMAARDVPATGCGTITRGTSGMPATFAT
jgi:hypothetical protein